MGFAFNVDVKEIRNKAILDAATTPVTTATVKGTIAGIGHRRHGGGAPRLEQHDRVPLPAEERADAGGREVVHRGRRRPSPRARSSSTGSAADLQAAQAAVEAFGLTAAALTGAPTVATHDADVPRVAIYSQWSGTQELGWYRHAFDQFGIPFDLIYKERVAKGNLKADYDVIVMAAQNITQDAGHAGAGGASAALQEARDKLKFLGMYGETDDMTGGFGQAGVDAFETFLEAGGTLITTLAVDALPDRVRVRALGRHGVTRPA